MKESYRVLNTTRGSIIFNIYPPQDMDALFAVAGHHRRKTLRSSVTVITLEPSMSKDIVEETGLSLKEVKNNIELYQLIQSGKLMVVETSSTVEVKDEPPIPEEIEEEEVEDETEEVEEGTEIKKKRPGRPKKK